MNNHPSTSLRSPNPLQRLLAIAILIAQLTWAINDIASAMESLLARFDLPPPCGDRIEQLKHLTPTKAANELFFEVHPERHRREIGQHESQALKDEWWGYYDQVQSCRKRKGN